MVPVQVDIVTRALPVQVDGVTRVVPVQVDTSNKSGTCSGR